MKKMKLKTKDGIDANLEKLSELFPEVVTETKGEDGELKRVANFDILKSLLDGNVADPNEKECYEFTWPGKREAIAEAARGTTNTLRPCKEESKDWNTTQNLYIEGDNLEVLKLLQESYLGKVKMIYIDPPYNTGEDFIYRDNFYVSAREYRENTTERDDDNNKLFQNTKANGRFHSDWLSMMSARLRLSRNLLSDIGAIFISIDDNELRNVLKLTSEVFGEDNFLATFIWEKRTSRENRKVFSVNHDYIIGFAKNRISFQETRGVLPYTEEVIARYRNPDNDSRGPWQSVALSVQGGHGTRSQFYEIETPSGRKISPPSGLCWRFTKQKLESLINDNRIWFGESGDNVPRLKLFLSEVDKGLTPHTLWRANEVGTTDSAKREINILFDGCSVFETPKPVDLIKRLALIATSSGSDDVVLDFFSGSASTAHAVMQLNADDKGGRRFIMIQVPEECGENSEAFRSGYKTIAEIGKERIRRAGEKIKVENATTAANLDVGFKVLKLSDSNMKDVYYTPSELSKDMLAGLESNIKEDRTELDLLFSCLIDWGVELSLPIKTENIDGVEIHIVNDGEIPDLIACFASSIPEAVIKRIAERNSLRVVFRDISFADSPAKINVTEIFKTISPTTTIKML